MSETDNIQYDTMPELSIGNGYTANIEQLVRRYLDNHSPHVFILTPCFGGMCYVDYMTSIINTLDLFRSLGINVKLEFCGNDSLVMRARNNLVAKAMSDPMTTHIMFIDNDIRWDPMSILKLLISDKPVIGGVYPLKHFFHERLVGGDNVVKSWLDKKNATPMRDVVGDADFVEQRLLRYNVNYLEDGKMEVDNNIGEVRHIATGFLMIQRHVIEKMFLAFPSTKYVDDVSFLKPHENEFAYALFDCGVEDGHYMSEDWMFCSRWRKMGGNVFIDVSIDLTHIGTAKYNGAYISSLL
jgi:hypothetical protein